MGKNIVFLLLVLLLSLVGVWSLFHPGLHPTHDGEYHVVRFYEFDKVLRSGDFYPRWASDLNMGYGVPLFNFVYPLPNYVASLLHIFGISFIDAFKLSFVIATLLGAYGMYLWSRLLWGRLGGLVSSVLYSFAPYRFVDIYIRGSVGEVWALAFAPFVLLGITKVIKDNDTRYLPLISIGLAFLIFSHNILALLFFWFILTYSAFLVFIYKSRTHIKSVSLSIILGLGISAIFWLPALLEKQFVRGLEVFSLDRHFVELYQLLIPSWGSGFSGDISQGLSFQIGIVNVLILMISIIVLVRRKNNNVHRNFLLFFLAWVILLCFLMLSFSESIWNIVPLLTYFQFPWRLLSLVILLVAFMGGVVGTVRFAYAFSLIVIIFVILSTYSYTIPAYFHERSDEYYITRSNFIHGTNSPGNVFNTVWFEQKSKPVEEKLILQGEGTIESTHIKPTQYTAEIDASENGSLIINTAYFPGWKVLAADNLIEPRRTKGGAMVIDLPEGSYSLRVFFADTMIRYISTSITIISSVMVVLLFMFYKTRHENCN